MLQGLHFRAWRARMAMQGHDAISMHAARACICAAISRYTRASGRDFRYSSLLRAPLSRARDQDDDFDYAARAHERWPDARARDIRSADAAATTITPRQLATPQQ